MNLRGMDGSYNGYFASLGTLIMAWLSKWTPQDIMFAVGTIIAAIIAILTYLSNRRRNNIMAKEDQARTKLLADYINSRRAGSTSPAPDGLDNIATQLDIVESETIV